MGLFSHLFGSSAPSLDAAQAHSKLRQAPGGTAAPLLLDVRQPEEYKEGHIEGAKLIPLGDLAQRIHELPRDREIICVCRSGNRSGRAVQILGGQGYRAVNLSGGMIGWSRAGLPIKKGAAR